MAQDKVVSSASDQNSDSESEEDDEGDLAESFDPVSFYNRSSSTPLPEGMGSYVKSHFRKCLTSSIRVFGEKVGAGVLVVGRGGVKGVDLL